MGTGIIKCHSGNECRLVTKLRKCAPSTGSDWRGSLRKQPRGLQLPLLAQRVNVAQPVMVAQRVNVAQPVMVAQPVGVVTVSLGGPASGRWHGKCHPSPCVTSVTSVTSSLTALVTFWLRYLPLSEPCFLGVTSVTNFFQVSSS